MSYNVDAITKNSNIYQIMVIEDSARLIISTYKSSKHDSFGDISLFLDSAYKLITTSMEDAITKYLDND